jgi:GT2 family glycosyltransferase
MTRHSAPSIALIIQSFNRRTNVASLCSGTRAAGPAETIVCDDGSIDGSRGEWMSRLDGAGEVLIFSNDLHEIRILDRAIRFASAEVVCIIQDDDRLPGDRRWLSAAREIFLEHPSLAILGGFMGFHGFDPDPRNARRIWGPAPFQFVDHVNIGPYFIRRKHYLELGGWDFSFSRAGEPGICFDNELCLRAWVNGYRVGYQFVPLKGPPGSYSLDGGTMLFSPGERRENQIRNQRTIFERHRTRADRISRAVHEANAELSRVRPSKQVLHQRDAKDRRRG